MLATVQEERAFEMPMPPDGTPRLFPGVVAATAAVIRWRCDALGLWSRPVGETPVMVASRSGYAAIVELLIAKGGNVNAHGARGQTALMWAAAQKHPDVVKVLLAHGADVHARSEVWSEVMAVPPHGHLEYNRAIPHGGDTALMFAARVGDLESAKQLVAAVDAKPDATVIEDTAERIAAIRASAEGKEGVTAFLEKRKPEWAR